MEQFQCGTSYHQREYRFRCFNVSFCIVALTAWIFEHFLASIIVCAATSDRFSTVIKDLSNRKQCVVVSSSLSILILLMSGWSTFAVIWKASVTNKTVIYCVPKLVCSHRLQCHGHQKFRPKNQIKMHLLSKVFQPYFPSHRAGSMLVYSVKSRFWTNEELSLMVAWSSSVSISHSKVQSSIGHLVTCNTGGKEKYQDIEAHF